MNLSVYFILKVYFDEIQNKGSLEKFMDKEEFREVVKRSLEEK
nr:hypothetical protein [uncultured Chryseobacterium sp.]